MQLDPAFRDPDIPDGERTTFRGTISGTARGQARAEPPHRFVRFSFPTGSFPWNPRGLIEATAIS